MLEQGDLFWAQHYLGQACALYSEWNANVKVEQMRKRYEFLDENSVPELRHSSGIQGRSMFDSNKDSFRLQDQPLSKEFRVQENDDASSGTNS